MNDTPRKKLREVSKLIGGGTPSRKVSEYFGGDFRWVTPTDLPPIGNVRTLQSPNGRITAAGLANSSAKLCPPGSVLFSSRASIGKIAVADTEFTTNQGFCNFVPDAGVLDSWFLAYYLAAAREEIVALAGETTFKEVSRKKLGAFEIPVPSLSEQRRIVARIREAMERVDEVRRLREETVAASTALLPSLLKEVFDEVGSQNPALQPLGDIIEGTKYGTSKKCATNIDGLPILRIPNIGVGGINLEKMKYLPWQDANVDKLALRKGDLLIVRTNGSPGLVGRCAVFDLDETFGYASYLIRVRPTPDMADSRYLAYYLASTGGRDQIATRRRTSAGQFNINSSNLKTIKVPLPSLAIQYDLVERMDDIRTAVTATLTEKTELQQSEAALVGAILRKAFAGEL